MKQIRWNRLIVVAALAAAVLGAGFFGPGAAAQTGDLEQIVTDIEQAKEGLTLWEMIRSGGLIMIVLALLSVAAGALVINNFMTLKEDLLIPSSFTDDVIAKMEAGNERALKAQVLSEQNVISRIVQAGLSKKNRGVINAKEAMETAARQEIGALWQNISYLADIAALSPLVGLLGTVLGMIQAFNVIAFQTAVVKPLLLAGGVSKAMVTTAGGLIVAIPVMVFYAYFRGRVQRITNLIESYSSDLMKLVENIFEQG